MSVDTGPTEPAGVDDVGVRRPGPVEVSVVLPAYNEANTLESTVETTIETLSSFLPTGSFEVIVAEDGCEDRTPAIADRLASGYHQVEHVHSEDRLGRGGALERAFRSASGDVLVYFDTDLATDMSHLEELVESVRTGGYDVATGSRRLPGEEAARPPKRDVASRGFNGLVRLFLRSDLQDHQCGFKAFDRGALMSLLGDVEDEHWFWDTEVLVRAQREGYRVKEFPVDWTPKGDTKVDLVRDVLGMGGGILRTWWELSVEPRITPRTTLALGTALVVAATALLANYVDTAELLGTIAGADPVVLGAAAAVYLVSWPVRGMRYRRILDGLGYHEGTGFLTGAIFISQTGNLVFPARAGDAVRAYVLKARRHVPYSAGAASLAVERVFDLLVITALAAAVAVGLATVGGGLAPVRSALSAGTPGGTAVMAAGVVAAGAVLVTGLILVSARSAGGSVRGWIGRASSDAYADVLADVFERFAGDVQRIASDRELSARVSASSLLIWTLDVATGLLVLVALGVDVPLATLVAATFFAVSVGNLAKVLPLSPGGIGLYEGAFALLFVALTPVSGAVALAAAIVDHVIKNAVTIAGGFASMVVLNVSLTTAVEEGRDVDAVAGD